MLSLSAEVKPGDGGYEYAEVIIGTVKVTVYESLHNPGRVIVDVDTDDGARLAVYRNDRLMRES